MQKFLSTKEDVLVVALRYIDELEVVHDTFAKEYGLRPNTLTDISNGKILKRDRTKYRDAFIHKLETLRKNAEMRHKDALENRIKDMVYSIALVELGVASLDEQRTYINKEKKEIFMRQFR